MTLLWRVFGTNAAILVLATLALVVSPLTVSFPIALVELVALGGGLVAMLVLNLALLRRTFRPLGRLTTVMRRVDPLRPGERAPLAEADPEVTVLTAAFNDMLDRLEAERRDSGLRALRRSEGESDGGSRVSCTTRSARCSRRRPADARLADRSPPELARRAEALRETVLATSSEEVRTIARRLRPEALDDSRARRALTNLTNGW